MGVDQQRGPRTAIGLETCALEILQENSTHKESGYLELADKICGAHAAFGGMRFQYSQTDPVLNGLDRRYRD